MDQKDEQLSKVLQGSGIEELLEPNPETAKPSPISTKARLLEMLDRIDDKQCRGCGAKFQFEQEKKEGYIDLGRLKKDGDELDIKKVIEKMIVDRNTSQDLDEATQDSESRTSEPQLFSVQDYEKDAEGLEGLEEVEQLFEQKVAKREICDRCVLISNGEFEKLREIEVNIESRIKVIKGFL